MMSPDKARKIASDGLDALRRGDAASARSIFERLLVEAPHAPPPWLPLAQAYRLADDRVAETRALEALLETEPRNLPALLLMGERKQIDGDDRAANAFYSAALNQASLDEKMPAGAGPLLEKARAFVEIARERFADHLTAAIPSRPTPRVRRALDVLLGRSPLYQQQPSMFYFPGLEQRPFFDRKTFEWVGALESQTSAIRAELEAVDGSAGFRPYVEGTSDRPRPANPLLDDPAWSAFYLWRNGAPVIGNAEHCPRTLAALADIPIPHIAGRSPMALFSRLLPGTHIRPHHGLLNTRLICHLPIIVPPGCAMRVGDETRVWREGELTIFDDSFEHEAWNRGPATRTVLLFEIWRPDISSDERAELTHLFEAIDRYGGSAIDQG